MELSQIPLENGSAALFPLEEAHRDCLRKIGAEDSMWASMPVIDKGIDFDRYFDYFMRATELGETIAFAVLNAKTREFIGVTAFVSPNRTHRRVDIGYTWITPSARGGGMFAAVQHLLIGRALDWGCRRIGWTVESRNQRAMAAIRNIGAFYEGNFREAARFADGSWVDIAVLSLRRDEAKAVHAQLEAQWAA